jgi:hypothetical protein
MTLIKNLGRHILVPEKSPRKYHNSPSQDAAQSSLCSWLQLHLALSATQLDALPA